ncbi:hypothetical protein BH24ACT6_BH24ACT6_12070 [soil metagenome]
MAGTGFAVVDVETSGLSTRRHRVLQIGVVNVGRTGSIEDSWSSLVALPRRFSRVGLRRVHGITRRALRGAPSLDAAMAEVSARTNGRILVAHNIGFDLEFLERAARRSHIDLDVCGLLCTLVLSRRLDPERALGHRLVDVAARHGVSLDRPHDALADAYATAEVLPHLPTAHGIELDAGSADPEVEPLDALMWERRPPRRRGLRGALARRRRSHARTLVR